MREFDRRAVLRHAVTGAAVAAVAGVAGATFTGCAEPESSPVTPRKTYLTGVLAPVGEETTAENLTVDGRIPPELSGRYLRNGPNPKPGTDTGLWWSGAGMIHGVRLRDGRAEWYRNRWVRTVDAPQRTPDGKRDLRVGAANTNIIAHGGRILALYEVSYPYRLSPDLDTLGPYDFGGRLHTPMTAHPKVDPVTGELHFFGFSQRPPQLTYYRASAAGLLEHSLPITLPGPESPFVHDFAITADYVIWPDLPVVWDRAAQQAGFPNWSDTHPARLGVMPRNAASDTEIRWYPVDPRWAFHIGNAYQLPDGRIVVDGISGDREAWRGVDAIFKGTAERRGAGFAYRWILDPATGTSAEYALDDTATEFPTINDTHLGRPHRYLYSPTSPLAPTRDNVITKLDTGAGTRSVHRLAPDIVSGETVFAPAAQPTGEDGGYLISIVHNAARDQSALLILDATALTSRPLATVHLPHRVPYGFHGHWIPDPQ